jgi:hypothetical protein
MNWRIPTAFLVVCAGALYLCSRPLDIVAPNGTIAGAPTDYQSTFWNHAPEWTVALATVLTLFGILYQADEMKKATAAMKESTGEVTKQTAIMKEQVTAAQDQIRVMGNQTLEIQNQATIMERQLVLDKRPKIIIRNLYFTKIQATHGFVAVSGVQVGSTCMGQFYVVNAGGTNAHIKEIYCESDTYPEVLPMMRPYEGKVGEKVEMTLAPGQSVPCVFQRDAPLSIADSDAIYAAQHIFFRVIGQIGYTDDLGIYRRTSFCRQYDRGSARFIPEANPDYENAD